MGRVPAKCPSCGLIFESGVSVLNSESTTFSNGQAQCPRCQSVANILDGTFDFVGDVLSVRSAPRETRETLKVLQEALRAAQRGKSDAEVIASIGRNSHLAAQNIQYIKTTTGASLAAILLLLLSNCSLQVKMDVKLDLNRMYDQVYTSLGGGSKTGQKAEMPSNKSSKTSAPRE